MLKSIRLRLGRVPRASSRQPIASLSRLKTSAYRGGPAGIVSDIPDRRSFSSSRSVNAEAGPSRPRLADHSHSRAPRRKSVGPVSTKSRFEYSPDGRLISRTPTSTPTPLKADLSSSNNFDDLDLSVFGGTEPVQPEIIAGSPGPSGSPSSSNATSQGDAEAASSEPEQATIASSPELDEFFGEYLAPEVAPLSAASDPSSAPTVPTTTPPTSSTQTRSTLAAPLASYTPPTHSGVVQIKSYLLEFKFLSTQELFQMATGHLRAPIQPAHVVEPDGRIRMKRVATMREGRRTWIPPATPKFPDHPFRSVRFLKETLLASLENAGLIHKRCLARPLETEEEHEAAIKKAESQNRKLERRAALKGLPTPPVKAPATSLPVWGWMLGPRPEMVVHPEDAEYAARLARGGLAEVDLSRDEKERRSLSGEAVYREGEMGLEEGRVDAQDQQMEYEANRSRQTEATGEVFGRQMDSESERRSWGSRGAPPSRAEEQVPYKLRASTEDSPHHAGGEEHLYHKEKMRKVRHIFPPPYSIEDARLKDDYDVSHLQWRWAETAEYEYHKAKLAEAEAAAERQQVRRARNRERAELKKLDDEKIEQEGLAEEVEKEKRRLEAIEHVLDYARLTGHDVSGWIGEMQGKLGEYIPYEPRFEHRGGAVPRGKSPRAKWKTHGFPIN